MMVCYQLKHYANVGNDPVSLQHHNIACGIRCLSYTKYEGNKGLVCKVRLIEDRLKCKHIQKSVTEHFFNTFAIFVKFKRSFYFINDQKPIHWYT